MLKKYNGQIDITEVKNAQYITEEGHIDCEINHPEYGWIPYTIAPDDGDMTIDNQQLLDLIEQKGGAASLTEEIKYERYSNFVRIIRSDKLQNEVDPVATNPLRWNSLSSEEQNEYTTYRQALLDVTEQEEFPYNIVWPRAPGFVG